MEKEKCAYCNKPITNKNLNSKFENGSCSLKTRYYKFCSDKCLKKWSEANDIASDDERIIRY